MAWTPTRSTRSANLIRRMAPEKAIVISTHILEEVDAVCTRAMIIAHGRVVADATPAELQQRHPSGKLDEVFRELTMRDRMRRTVRRWGRGQPRGPAEINRSTGCRGDPHERSAAADGAAQANARHSPRIGQIDMRNILIVARRELAAYFATPVADRVHRHLPDAARAR